MRSLLRFALIVFTLGIATLLGCSGKTGPPASTGPSDVTLIVPGMH